MQLKHNRKFLFFKIYLLFFKYNIYALIFSVWDALKLAYLTFLITYFHREIK